MARRVILVGPQAAALAEDRTALGRADIVTLGAADAEAALLLHREQAAALIVVDLQLPDGGDRLCRRVRSDPEMRQVSLLLLCPDDGPSQQRARSCGANGVLTLPVSREALDAELARLLEVPPRRCFRALLAVTVEGQAGGQAFFCSLRDLGVHGALIESSRALAVGDTLTCSFFLPGGARVTTDGSVVRVTPQRDVWLAGVRFALLSRRDESAIAAFVKSQILERR